MRFSRVIQGIFAGLVACAIALPALGFADPAQSQPVAPTPSKAGTPTPQKSQVPEAGFMGSATPTQPQVEVSPVPQLSGYYEAANENLMLQWKYLDNRVDTTRALMAVIKDSKDDDSSALDKVSEQTEGFCSKPSDKNAGLTCLGYYLDTQVTELERVKSALTQNDDSVSRLSTSVYAPNGQLVSGPGTNKELVPAQRLMPGQHIANSIPRAVPKLIDFGNVQAMDESAWVVNLTRAPTAQDYIKTEDVKFDPTDNTHERMQRMGVVVQTDQTAFGKAQSDLQSGKGRYKYRDKYFATKVAQAGVLRMQQNKMTAGKMKVKDAANAMERQDYIDARNFVVAAYNMGGAAAGASAASRAPTAVVPPPTAPHNVNTNHDQAGLSKKQKDPSSQAAQAAQTAATGQSSASSSMTVGQVAAEEKAEGYDPAHPTDHELELKPLPKQADGSPIEDTVYMDPQYIQDSIDHAMAK